MLLYCLKCRKKSTEDKNPNVVKTKKQKKNAFVKIYRV